MTTDKQLLKKRFAATFRQYDSLAVVQQEICGQLDEMIGRICPGRIGRAMEVGCGTGFLTRYLLRRYPDAEWIVNDLIEESEIYLRPYASGHYVEYLWGDAELLPLPGELDMIASGVGRAVVRQPAAFYRPRGREPLLRRLLRVYDVRYRQFPGDPGYDRRRVALLYQRAVAGVVDRCRIRDRRNARIHGAICRSTLRPTYCGISRPPA